MGIRADESIKYRATFFNNCSNICLAAGFIGPLTNPSSIDLLYLCGIGIWGILGVLIHIFAIEMLQGLAP